MKTTIIIVVCSLFYYLSSAQHTTLVLSGTVKDYETQKPVEAASVYINNTTYGCQAGKDGSFHLNYSIANPIEITISAIGYETESVIIENNNKSIIVQLKAKSQRIDEVVILSPEKDGWAKYGRNFFKNFIGYSPFAAECEILNKEVIEFRYDKTNNKLLVSAEKPLKIRNKATGYLITYWLDDYELDYTTRRQFYKGYAQFETLQSKKEKANKKWEQNRLLAYKGSLMHFMRSVYNNTVYEDSFELRILKRFPEEEYGRMVPIKTDTLTGYHDSILSAALLNFLAIDSSLLNNFLKPIKFWFSEQNPKTKIMENMPAIDSTATKAIKLLPFSGKKRLIQYYDYTYTPPDTAYENALKRVHISDSTTFHLPKKRNRNVAYLWKELIPTDSFVTRKNGNVILKFKDFLHVTYLSEKEEQTYIDMQFPRTHTIPELQQSIISVENEAGVTVLSDGNYYNAYDLITEEYWSYEKMDKMLPLDYDEKEFSPSIRR